MNKRMIEEMKGDTVFTAAKDEADLKECLKVVYRSLLLFNKVATYRGVEMCCVRDSSLYVVFVFEEGEVTLTVPIDSRRLMDILVAMDAAQEVSASRFLTQLFEDYNIGRIVKIENLLDDQQVNEC